jgi:hypothetical protein
MIQLGQFMPDRSSDGFENKIEKAKQFYFLLNELTINKKPEKNEGYKTQAY